MHIYNYDRITGVFVGRSDADPSPIEPGKFLIPAFSTHKEPPSAQDGKAPVFNTRTGDWEMVDVKAPASQEQIAVQALTEPTSIVQFLRARLAVHINQVALVHDFDSIDEAVSYADEPSVPRYQALGRALRAWRSIIWAAFETLESQIKLGEIPPPASDAEFFEILPKFTPPAAPAEA